MDNFLTYNELKLAFRKIGHGSKVALAFHGFGRTASDFEIFEPLWGSEYTIYSFDLFHHGKSEYPDHRIDKESFSKKDLKALMTLFFEKHPCHRVRLMGYSLGGKFALMLIELFPEIIQDVWLFAPDGIKKNFWYHFASNTFVGKNLYKYFLKHPRTFFAMVESLHKSGIINEKLKKFAFNNMDEAEKRELVYKVWATFKKVNPDIRTIADLIAENNIQVYQFFGKYDQVIKPELGKWFAAKINQSENLHVLDTGHALLTTKTIAFIERNLEKD